MKKKSIIALLVALCLVFCFTLTACGGNSDEPSDAQEEAAEETVEEEIETLETIINNDSSLKEQVASGSGQEGLTIEVKDNDINYIFDMTAISDLSEEQLKDQVMIEALDDALDEGKDQFINLCTTLEDQTGLEGVHMIVTYTYKEDVLTTRTFDKNGVVE